VTATASRVLQWHGHTVEIASADGERWTIRVDGRQAQLRVRTTESSTGNSGTRFTNVIADWQSVDTTDLSPLLGLDTSSSRSDDGGLVLRSSVTASSGSVYNTTVYVCRSISVVCHFDNRPVDITFDEHADVSD
jgi:hypothetical protein